MATALGESQTIANTDTAEATPKPSQEQPTTVSPEPAPSRRDSTPVPHRQSSGGNPDPNAFRITILLASSGYKTRISVNRAFLEKASLHEGDGFPVGALKSAIWKDWPSDWPEPLPPSPNFLRLIYSGRMLADKSTLADYNIGPGKPNVLHLSIRPADFVEDEYETNKKIPGIPRRSNGGCCNCIIC